MYRISALVLLVLAVVLVTGTSDAQTCNDPYFVLRGGSQPEVVGGTGTISLPANGSVGPTSMSLTTVPAYKDFGFNFVTQNHELHLIKYDSTEEELTLDLKAEAGLPGTVILYDVIAAHPVEVVNGSETEVQYALYVVGFHSNGFLPEPYYWVLDQVAILDRWEEYDPSAPYLLGDGELCEAGQSCGGVAGEIQVFSQTGQGSGQIAYAQMLEFTINPIEQRIMKLSRNNNKTNAWQVTISHDLEPGNTAFPNLGFAFDRQSRVPYGAVGGAVMNLDTNTTNCSMGDVVTDLAIWSIVPEFNQSFAHHSYSFATVQTGSTSKLIGYPTDTCPDTNLDSTIEVSVPHAAIKVFLQKMADNELVARALSSDGTVTNITLEIQPANGAAEDKIVVTKQSTTSAGSNAVDFSPKPTNLCGCATTPVSFGDPPDDVLMCTDTCFVNESGLVVCSGDFWSEPAPPRCLDPNDPACETPVGDKTPEPQ